MPKPSRLIFGLDVEALAAALAPLVADHLVRELPAVADRLAREGGQALSAVRAARMAKCRNAVVVAAMRSGALPARRTGNRWQTTAAETMAWIQAGRPER